MGQQLHSPHIATCKVIYKFDINSLPRLVWEAGPKSGARRPCARLTALAFTTVFQLKCLKLTPEHPQQQLRTRSFSEIKPLRLERLRLARARVSMLRSLELKQLLKSGLRPLGKPGTASGPAFAHRRACRQPYTPTSHSRRWLALAASSSQLGSISM